MKTRNKILFIISFAPLIITAIALPFMNDTVPMHYNAAGEVDRYGSKYENFIFPVEIMLFYLFWVIYVRYYSHLSADDDERIKSNLRVVYIVAIAISSMFCVMQCAFLAIALTNEGGLSDSIDLFLIINLAMSVLFVIIGNFLPKTKRNSVLGVRTSWTLKSDKAWYSANRSCGIAWVIAGFFSIILSSLVGGCISTILIIVIIVLATAAAYICSYFAVEKG